MRKTILRKLACMDYLWQLPLFLHAEVQTKWLWLMYRKYSRIREDPGDPERNYR